MAVGIGAPDDSVLAGRFLQNFLQSIALHPRDVVLVLQQCAEGVADHLRGQRAGVEFGQCGGPVDGLGDAYEDGSGTKYLSLIGQPILIYGADRAALSRALDRALARNVMPIWAQYLGEGLPLTHYIRIVRAIMLKGAGIQNLQYDTIALIALMLLAMTIAVTRFRRTLD